MCLITFAGLPATIVFASTFFTTTDPAPIIELSPIIIGPNMIQCGAIITLFPMMGDPRSSPDKFSLFPIVVLCLIVTLFPITKFASPPKISSFHALGSSRCTFISSV